MTAPDFTLVVDVTEVLPVIITPAPPIPPIEIGPTPVVIPEQLASIIKGTTGPQGIPGEQGIPGAQGPAGYSPPAPVFEALSGACNGNNCVFTLSQTPVTGSVLLMLNGLAQATGSDNDFTITGVEVEMNFAPRNGDYLTAFYTPA